MRKFTIWDCKIGAKGDLELPRGADAPMREAIAKAFKEITGHEAEFNFSGWGGELTERELAVLEDRLPKEEHPLACLHINQGSADAAAEQYSEEFEKAKKPLPKVEAEDWFFTFCGNHEHRNGYVKIHGTYYEARKEMVRRYGQEWAFQYDAKAFEGQPERYGLTELKHD